MRYQIYSELEFRISKEINEGCLFETNVWRNKTALIVQQIIRLYFDKIQEFFFKPFLEYPCIYML